MSRWLLLHQGSVFGKSMARHLGDQALHLSTREVIDQLEIRTSVSPKSEDIWIWQGEAIPLQSVAVYQDIFFSLKYGMQMYCASDHDYVEGAWQSYLLARLRHAKWVNPIAPRMLSTSYFQSMNVLRKARQYGLSVPRISIFKRPKYAHRGYEQLWFQPQAKQGDALFVESFSGTWLSVPFISHQTYFWVGADMDAVIKEQLRALITDLGLNVGELYLHLSDRIRFYGLSPSLSAQHGETALSQVAENLVRSW